MATATDVRRPKIAYNVSSKRHKRTADERAWEIRMLDEIKRPLAEAKPEPAPHVTFLEAEKYGWVFDTMTSNCWRPGTWGGGAPSCGLCGRPHRMKADKWTTHHWWHWAWIDVEWDLPLRMCTPCRDKIDQPEVWKEDRSEEEIRAWLRQRGDKKCERRGTHPLKSHYFGCVDDD